MSQQPQDQHQPQQPPQMGARQPTYNPQGGERRDPWQQQPQPGNAYRGDVPYPAAVAGAHPTTPVAPPPVRERKPLIITDKDGIPMCFTKPSKATTTWTTPAPTPAAAAAFTASADAGEQMKQATLGWSSAVPTKVETAASPQQIGNTKQSSFAVRDSLTTSAVDDAQRNVATRWTNDLNAKPSDEAERKYF